MAKAARPTLSLAARLNGRSWAEQLGEGTKLRSSLVRVEVKRRKIATQDAGNDA